MMTLGRGEDVKAFEGNLAIGSHNLYPNESDGHVYLYDMTRQIDNINNPIVLGKPNSYVGGISGDYVIGTYHSTDPIFAPTPTPVPATEQSTESAPVVSFSGVGGSHSKKKSAKKSSVKNPATKKKSSKKRK